MFAIQEFFWGLPEAIREAAFRNNAKWVQYLIATSSGSKRSFPDSKVAHLGQALDAAFNWEHTPEGISFWRSLAAGEDNGHGGKRSFYEIGKLYEMSREEEVVGVKGRYFKVNSYDDSPRGSALINGFICNEYGEPLMTTYTNSPLDFGFWLTGSSHRHGTEWDFNSHLRLLPVIVEPKTRPQYAWRKPDVSQRALILD